VLGEGGLVERLYRLWVAVCLSLRHRRFRHWLRIRRYVIVGGGFLEDVAVAETELVLGSVLFWGFLFHPFRFWRLWSFGSFLGRFFFILHFISLEGGLEVGG